MNLALAETYQLPYDLAQSILIYFVAEPSVCLFEFMCQTNIKHFKMATE